MVEPRHRVRSDQASVQVLVVTVVTQPLNTLSTWITHLTVSEEYLGPIFDDLVKQNLTVNAVRISIAFS